MTLYDRVGLETQAYPPFFGDLALSLQLRPGLSSLQDAMILFCIDVQRFLLKHLGPWQRNTLHGWNCTTSRHHLIEGETQRGIWCFESQAGKHQHTDTNKQLLCK